MNGSSHGQSQLFSVSTDSRKRVYSVRNRLISVSQVHSQTDLL